MSTNATLPPQVHFVELPFCGVVIDTRTCAVYRLSQAGAAAVRNILAGEHTTGPYERLVATPSEGVGVDGAQLVATLAARGLLLVETENATRTDVPA